MTNATQPNLDQRLLSGVYQAIDRSQAVIRFKPDGTIIHANHNFLAAMGYELDEIAGQHHKMFAADGFENTPEYKDFWSKLNSGTFHQGQYKRLAKGAKEVWIQATYNPIFDQENNLVEIVKFAVDITEQKAADVRYQNQIKAIDQAQAGIEFDLDGNILDANSVFLKFMGYEKSDIVGKHHRIFCEPELVKSRDYKTFWHRLKSGDYQHGDCKRLNAKGETVWIRASYTPVMDVNGKPDRIIKVAADITQQTVENQNLSQRLEKTSRALEEASTTLTNAANIMLKSSEEAESQAKEVSLSSDGLAENVKEVARSTDEMSSTVGEISTKARETSTISADAKHSTEKASGLMEGLESASNEISTVIKLISSIAQQTNLLALNATIEAARAGESGRGFSVVANEVKELANQTAVATEKITQTVNTITGSTAHSIEAIKEISSIIEKVNENAMVTATATEEQGATTTGVRDLISKSSDGIHKIVGGIHEVSKTCSASLQGAKDTLEAANKLSSIAEDLMGVLNQRKFDQDEITTVQKIAA
ncbi:MAG: PAS domain-containing methyl-accepting chemotaxis protein [Pseudobacteriovorax sp.]|nr:PAS domain-containing methyl-accepting chemotaxis protein [Pseudobacteriovorax sp.]